MEEKKLTYLEPGSDAFNASMEEYRQELLKDGWKEDSQGYKSLMALHKHLISTTDEELEKEWAEVEERTKGIEGPTVDEYFESINPQAMYQKGYREGALRYKALVEEFFKGWVAQIRERQAEDAKARKEKEAELRKKFDIKDDEPAVFISPGISARGDMEFHPRPIEDIIESYILPQMQEIFDNN
jgi:hypothetical protein